jgi:hypothetical protein
LNDVNISSANDDISAIPLFAFMANSYLQAFNALRLVPAVDCMISCYQFLVDSLEMLLKHVQQQSSSLQDKVKQDKFDKILLFLESRWVPFILNNYVSIYPGMLKFLERKHESLVPATLLKSRLKAVAI